MKFSDILKLSFDSLIHRKIRSWLTIVGIVIGVAAIVVLISLAQGVRESIESELSAFGADTIAVIPGYFRALGEIRSGFQQSTIGNLTENDVRIIKTISGVVYVDGIISEEGDVSFGGQTASVDVNGVDANIWKLMMNIDLESGRYFDSGDTYVAVLGNRIANDLFEDTITLNRQIKINGKTFRVIGILKEAGAFGTFDSMIFIPKETAKIVLESNKLVEIAIKISEQADSQIISEQIERRLLFSHHLTKENQDFTVISSETVQETVNRISATMTFFLGSIAAISLLVGGIGIANTMFMSVMERTREIGILKALGATNSVVIKMFLIESALIGFIGGLIGIALGIFGSFLVAQVGISSPTGFSITTAITPELLIFALAFSVFVGVTSGIFPARKAARLQPVEALRYE